MIISWGNEMNTKFLWSQTFFCLETNLDKVPRLWKKYICQTPLNFRFWSLSDNNKKIWHKMKSWLHLHDLIWAMSQGRKFEICLCQTRLWSLLTTKIKSHDSTFMIWYESWLLQQFNTKWTSWLSVTKVLSGKLKV